jgi:hypothetical protein
VSRDALYTATVYKKDNTDDIPLKFKDNRFEEIDRYGKYSSLKTSYMVLTKDKKGIKNLSSIQQYW